MQRHQRSGGWILAEPPRSFCRWPSLRLCGSWKPALCFRRRPAASRPTSRHMGASPFRASLRPSQSSTGQPTSSYHPAASQPASCEGLQAPFSCSSDPRVAPLRPPTARRPSPPAARRSPSCSNPATPANSEYHPVDEWDNPVRNGRRARTLRETCLQSRVVSQCSLPCGVLVIDCVPDHTSDRTAQEHSRSRPFDQPSRVSQLALLQELGRMVCYL